MGDERRIRIRLYRYLKIHDDSMEYNRNVAKVQPSKQVPFCEGSIPDLDVIDGVTSGSEMYPAESYGWNICAFKLGI